MAFNQMFKKTVYAFVWLPAVRACREPSALSPPVNYFEMRRQRKYLDLHRKQAICSVLQYVTISNTTGQKTDQRTGT